ncbi:redoxin domain-containing protein [Winogradskyella sp.]|uniref:redoxin domain-containing protein n=1 Tax=Winogradskyella sp. TaxID=1883156 RepID=UPI003AB58673
MKKNLSTLVIFLLLTSCKDPIDNNGYILEVDIKNVKDSTKVYLYNYENLDSVDSTMVINEQFVFKGNVPYPSQALINVEGGIGFSFWLENTKLKIETSVQELRATGYGKNIRKIEGGIMPAFEKDYENYLAPIKTSISEKKEAFKANGFSKSEERVLDSLDAVLFHKTYDYFIQHPNTYFSLINMSENIYVYSKDSLETYYNRLSDALKITKKGKIISDYLFTKPILVGNEFIEIKGEDISGKEMKLSDFKGKTIFLNFWAGWCLPCVKKIKEVFPEIQKAYGKENFVIVNFSFDYETTVWKSMSKKLNISGPNFTNHKGFVGNPALVDYGVYQIPTSFIIDEKGIILKRLEYEDDLVKELGKVFAGKE